MSTPLGPGSVLAGWRLVRLLGAGGHGSVYLAEHPRRPGPVALKLVPLPPADAAQRAAFLRSAEVARDLVHPGIVALFDAGVEGGLGWLAMEAAPGVELERYTRPPRLLPEPLVLRAALRVAQALAYAHGRGVVHRDLKPANVLVHWPGDSLKLVDLGLARTADATQTATGIVPGTPAYMAPELLAGGLPTPRSDLYALGAMLFQLLAGRLPFEAPTLGELLHRAATEPAPDLARLCPALPPALPALVARLLAKSAAERPADAAAAVQSLQAIAAAWPAAS
ncbi:MAG: serine/threonine protein kinase [Burkholderiales bacterium]|nr:serine/threonine protein kinase [Burkholderiales bacterium]